MLLLSRVVSLLFVFLRDCESLLMLLQSEISHLSVTSLTAHAVAIRDWFMQFLERGFHFIYLFIYFVRYVLEVGSFRTFNFFIFISAN